MKIGILSKQSGKTSRLRNGLIKGYFVKGPKAGEPFSIWNNDPLDQSQGQDTRAVTTSAVGKCDMTTTAEGELYWEFSTKSGTKYRLTLCKDDR